jgi:hypothetical protein
VTNRCYCIVIDVTQRMLAEEQLQYIEHLQVGSPFAKLSGYLWPVHVWHHHVG